MAKRKTEKDYHKLAKGRGFKWIGLELPRGVVYPSLWECKKCGYVWKGRYSNIQRGSGCPDCSGQAEKTKKDYHGLAKSRGFKWVGEVLPKNTKDLTLWECEKGDRWKASYNSIHRGRGCSVCSGHARKTKKDYHALAESCGFNWVGDVLPEYTKDFTLWKCKVCGNIRETIYNDIQQGSGCPACDDRVNGSLVSKPQIKLNNLLYGYLNYQESRYCIDVIIMRKSQKIAVEYDAQYWHKGREEHDTKRDDYLVSKGWKVLHIKSGTLLPTRKQTKQAINQLLKDRDIVNLYLEDWV
jgi:predicted Zn-ribbon and HTH transcriptional regulator